MGQSGFGELIEKRDDVLVPVWSIGWARETPNRSAGQFRGHLGVRTLLGPTIHEDSAALWVYKGHPYLEKGRHDLKSKSKSSGSSVRDTAEILKHPEAIFCIRT